MKLTLLVLALLASTQALELLQQLERKQLPKDEKRLAKGFSNVKWTDCDGTGSPYVVISRLDIGGSPVEGGTITSRITGTVKQKFTVTSLDVAAAVDGFKIYSGNVPLSQAQSYNPGPQDISFSETIHMTAPNGSYRVTTKLRDASGRELQCIYATFSIS